MMGIDDNPRSRRAAGIGDPAGQHHALARLVIGGENDHRSERGGLALGHGLAAFAVVEPGTRCGEDRTGHQRGGGESGDSSAACDHAKP